MAVGVVFGLAMVFVPLRFLPADNLVILAVVPAFWVGVFVHELGHVAAGFLAGLEFRRVLVGPLTFTREARGYRLRFIGKRFLAGGYTQMIPRSQADIRAKFLVFLAGGPIATLLLFVPVVLFPWGTATAALLFANVLLAPFCLIPADIQGHYTDARSIQVLLQKSPAAERMAAFLYLAALDGQGIVPSQWPAEVAAKLATEGGGSAYRATSRMFLHVYARETAPPAEVAAALEQVLALAGEMNDSLRILSFLEAAFFQGVTNRNGALARAWLDDARGVKRAIAQKGWDEKALLAIAYAEGNEAEFREHYPRALEYLDRLPGPSGSVASFRKQLVELSATALVPSTHPQARGSAASLP
jgi:Peptidase family M50